MYSILLVIIYISFISLGLPDSLLGSAWPSMYGELGVPVSFAGVVSTIIAGGTIISSFFSDKIIRKLGTGKVTAISVAMTAIALFGFSVSTQFWMLCVFSIPYGLGAGSVDAALNNFVALHYEARHMSWLHCFWGIGATVGPYIMGAYLTGGATWNSGYRMISLLQMALTAILLFTLPLWKEEKAAGGESEKAQKVLKTGEILKLSGAKAALLSFFCYCALEATCGLWAASYMVMHRGISSETAATWASLFYLGITIGRFLCGFISMKLGDKNMIRLGQGFMAAGVILLLFPGADGLVFAGLILIGLGCAPVYPCLIHETPENFGADQSQALIGMQMACAYVGTTLMPPLFGLIAQHIHIMWYPVYLAVFVVLMVLAVEKLNRSAKVGKKDQ